MSDSTTTADEHGPSVQFVLDHHEALSNHGGFGSVDSISVAFTLGFLAGLRRNAQLQLQNAQESSALPLQAVQRPPPTDVLFFDMDDCLYTNNWEVAKVVTQNIRSYCTDVMNLDRDAAYGLYKKYGTTLRGLLHDHIDSFDIDDYIEKAHDISSVRHLIQPDPELDSMLSRSRVPMWVFTAASKGHAHNCLDALGVRHFFGGRILACTSAEMGYGSKYEKVRRLCGTSRGSVSGRNTQCTVVCIRVR